MTRYKMLSLYSIKQIGKWTTTYKPWKNFDNTYVDDTCKNLYKTLGHLCKENSYMDPHMEPPISHPITNQNNLWGFVKRFHGYGKT